MSLFQRKDKRTLLEKEIDDVIKAMSKVSPDSEEYTKAAANLETLLKAKASEKKDRLTKNTIALVLGNIAVVGLTIFGEECRVITSKAMNYIIRGRVE